MSARKDPEQAFLDSYDPRAFPAIAVTVDLVVCTLIDAELAVLLVERAEPPFAGRWALPGGFARAGKSRTEQGEDLPDAARRELTEETGLSPKDVYLEQLGAFGKPMRDPRLRIISVAYFALVRPTLAPLLRPGGDVQKTRFFKLKELPALAFDHGEILEAATLRMRAELSRSPVAFSLVPETFTIQELRAVHEAILGEPLDPGNFRKKFLRLLEDNVVTQAPGKRLTASKPAHVYRFRR
jgi:8-oxo-dGTP diphosphatase